MYREDEKAIVARQLADIKGIEGANTTVFNNQSPEQIVEQKEQMMRSAETGLGKLPGGNFRVDSQKNIKMLWIAFFALAVYVYVKLN